MKKDTVIILPGQISIDEILSANAQATAGNDYKKGTSIYLAHKRIFNAYGVATQN